MHSSKQFRLDKALFALSCGLAVFSYGVAVEKYHLFPHSVLEFGMNSLSEVVAQRGTLVGTRPTEHLFRARYDGAGVTVNNAGKVDPGLTFLSGFFEGGTELRLIRTDGTVVHRWPVRFSALVTNTNHVLPKENVPKSDWNAEIHGGVPLPDGSVVFNFSYVGAVKVDRCGERQWTLPRMTHHAVSRAADGTFLMPSSRYIEKNGKHPNLHAPYLDETILKVSESGQVLSETSIFDILFENNYQGLLARGEASGDIIHVNDVEELTSDLAGAFPEFAAGDLMLSMRKGSSVMVVNPTTRRIRWYQAGPWRGQHDPDFLPNGHILIFNNNQDGTEEGGRFGGGSIMEVNPATSEVTYRFGLRDGERMYSDERGKHQVLQNGNLLVTEANSGRVFEVGPDGQIVWEFINRYDEETVAIVSEATRYPESYFTVRDWSCSTESSH